MMIKIAPASMTPLSKFVQILFKLCFIPVKFDTAENKFTFRLCSSVTAIFFLVYWGFFIGLQLLTQVAALELEDVVWKYFERTNIIDAISGMLFAKLSSGWPVPVKSNLN